MQPHGPARGSGSTDVAARGAPFREFLLEMRPAVERELTLVLHGAEQAARAAGPPARALVETLRSITLAAGKRLRPGLLLAAFKAVAPDAALAPALRVGAALELFQSYLLIHDDWMDGDVERRGVPTAHVRLAKHYGDRARGDASAVLAGDYACALAYRTLLRCGAAVDSTLRAAHVLARVEEDVIFGQQLDVAAEGTDPERVYALKTASYTVRAPLLLGCILAGHPEDRLDAVEAFARPLGIAFQLRDDLVALTGDPKKTGRARGSDLRAGKPTYCMRAAERLASPEERAQLSAVFGYANASDAELLECVETLKRCGAVHATEERIDALIDEALGALERSELDRGRTGLLAGAAYALAYRES